MKYIFSLSLCFFSLWALAQNAVLKGRITTADGQPAEFVNVFLKGTTHGTTADADGRYELPKLKAGDYTLQVSFVGLETQNRPVTLIDGQATEQDVTLSATGRQLQEVVVVANPSKYVADYPSISLRLRTPLLEVPQNIQVVTKQVIQDQQIFDMLEGVTRNVSGVTRAEHWDNYAQINMRGSRIAAFRNGMNIQMPFGPLTEDMSMVERIEFVKGPAGFMLANGEPSGFYNVVTKKPTGINKGEASVTLGSFNLYRSTLDLDGVLSKNGKLLYRLNAMGQLRGSHRDFEYNNRASIVPVLRYRFNERTSLTAEYTYQYSNMSMIGSNYAFSKTGYGDLPVNFTTAEENMPPTRINDHSLFLTLSHAFTSTWRFTGQVAYMNYNQIGQSIWPSGFSGDTLKRGMSIWDTRGINYLGQFFVNGEAKTGSITHHLLTGVDLGQKEYLADWNQSGAFPGLIPNRPVYGEVPVSAYPVFDRSKPLTERSVNYTQKYAGFYAQDEIHLFDSRLKLTVAGRFTLSEDLNPYSGTAKGNRFTPRLGFSYLLNKRTSLYGVYDQSFVPQAGVDFAGNSFKPITGTNHELGLKREWAGGLWTTTLAAYRITKNNVLTADPNHQNFSVQLGQTQTQGIEFDLRGQIVNGLDLTLNYAFTDSKVTKDTKAENVGVFVPGSTRHIANAWLAYRVTNGSLKGFGVSVGGQYQEGRSSWYVFDGGSQALKSYFRLDGAVSYQVNRFTVAANVNNLLNRYLYVGGAFYNWGSFYFWQTEPPRNARLSVAYRF